jgi:hypothetical protein
VSTVTTWVVGCSGAHVNGYSDWPIVELDVLDLDTSLPLCAVNNEHVDGYYGLSCQYTADPTHFLAAAVRFYNSFHVLMELHPLYVSHLCEENMANIDGTLEYQIQDDNGLVNPATAYILLADTKTLADIQTELNAMTPKLAAVVDGATTKINITLHFAVVSGNASPVAESNNQEGANLTFDVTGIKYPFTYHIPNFKDSLAVQGQIANAGATATLITYMLSGASAWDFIDRDLHVFAAFNRGRTSFRKLRKQLSVAASGRHNA